MDLSRAFESVPPGDAGGFDAVFFVLFAVAGLIIFAGFAFVTYSIVRGARAAKRAGVDPFTPESLLIAQALRGDGPKPLEARLAELDDLHRRGVISGEEHASARRKALEG